MAGAISTYHNVAEVKDLTCQTVAVKETTSVGRSVSPNRTTRTVFHRSFAIRCSAVALRQGAEH